MKNLNQLIIKFDFEKNFKDLDFYVSKSNQNTFNLIDNWPKWEKRFLNINGEKFSGKSHLVNIFLQRNNGFKFYAKDLDNEHLNNIKIHENIIIEDVDENIDEKLFYSLINIIDIENKYLIVTSKSPLVEFQFKLQDLISRSKNFVLTTILNPDDELMFALILKNLSDRQISLDKKLINYIIKRIDRSYSKISEFIYKIDEMSLKKKKPIDFKIIKEFLGE
jgi:chromosomal replication initiation ATPase DnaA